eukprot:scpid89440/ scgid4021/ 
MLVGQRLHGTVTCCECDTPRGIFSQQKLTAVEMAALERVKEAVEYTCGSPITAEDGPLHGKVFVQQNLRCADHVEFAYYACPRKLPDICCHCGSASAMRDPELVAKFKVVLPVCATCQKPAPTRHQRK